MTNIILAMTPSAGVVVDPIKLWGLFVTLGIISLVLRMLFKAGWALTLRIAGFLAVGAVALWISTILGNVEGWLLVLELLYFILNWGWARKHCFGSLVAGLITLGVLAVILLGTYVLIWTGVF